MHIQKLSFVQIKKYWIDNNHFSNVDGKKINRVVNQLGPYTIEVDHPRIQAYGLIDNDTIIGVTQFHQWTDNEVRFRTINIIDEYRGSNLGYAFLETLINQEWDTMLRLIGWLREPAFPWAQRNGFFKTNGIWHEHENSRYIMVAKNVNDIIGELSYAKTIDPEIRY